MKNIVLFSILLLIYNSCGKNKELKYYDNGNIKLSAELNKQGNKNGVVIEYYDDEKIKSEGVWKDGVPDGIFTSYYPEGNIQNVSVWNNGQLDSISIHYYKNGQVKGSTMYKSGLKHGTSILYNENGKLIEKQLYQNDELVYLSTYVDGDKFSSVLPLFVSEKDTVNLGESYRVKIKFGIPLFGSLKAYIGKSEKGELIDTLTVLYPDENNIFEYSTYSQTLGLNTFSLLIEHGPNAKDSLSANGVLVKHSYYVKRSSH